MKPKPTPKRSHELLEKKEKSILTEEDWYPTTNGQVQVMLFIYKKGEGPHRVCVWGGDDFGLEKEFEDPNQAKYLYETLGDYSSQSKMRQLGMITA